jgi:hypothetical protein
MPAPDLARIPHWYHKYIQMIEGDDLLLLMEQQLSSFIGFLRDIPASKRHYRYAEGKWSISDLVQHLIDGERIFAYRALRFARKDETDLPGFEENDYAENANADKRNWDDLLDEFTSLRRSNLAMFASFDEQALEREGTANGNRIYVRGIGFVMIGHVSHHEAILRERYL